MECLELGGTSEGYLIQPFHSSRATLSQLPRTISGNFGVSLRIENPQLLWVASSCTLLPKERRPKERKPKERC